MLTSDTHVAKASSFCRIEKGDPQETARRLLRRFQSCTHIVELSRRREDEDATFLKGYRLFALLDSSCKPSISNPGEKDGCDKAEGMGLWFLCQFDGVRPTMSVANFSVEVEQKWQDKIRVRSIDSSNQAGGSSIEMNEGPTLLVKDETSLMSPDPVAIVERSPCNTGFGLIRLTLSVTAANFSEGTESGSEVTYVGNLPVTMHRGVLPPSIKGIQEDSVIEFLQQQEKIVVSDCVVVGDYMRHNKAQRQVLQAFITKLMFSLMNKSDKFENYILWALPGTGKSFLIEQFKEVHGSKFEYFEFNVSHAKTESNRREMTDRAGKISEIDDRPVLCFLDEMDSVDVSDWSCTFAFNLLRLNNVKKNQVVCVVAGSHLSGMDAMIEQIRGFERKGSDLVDSLGHGEQYRVEIEQGDDGDRIVMFLKELLLKVGRRVSIQYIEKLALYYLLNKAEAKSSRAVAQLAKNVAARVKSDHTKITCLHFFARDQNGLQVFYREASDAAKALEGRSLFVVE